jgi:hypothetical protein
MNPAAKSGAYKTPCPCILVCRSDSKVPRSAYPYRGTTRVSHDTLLGKSCFSEVGKLGNPSEHEDRVLMGLLGSLESWIGVVSQRSVGPNDLSYLCSLPLRG